jgi:hypothetical protein
MKCPNCVNVDAQALDLQPKLDGWTCENCGIVYQFNKEVNKYGYAD